MVKEDILTAEEVAKYLRIHPYTAKARGSSSRALKLVGSGDFGEIK